MARNIESPGVQISEIDLSLNASLPVGTNILINGFTDQGPSQELLNITSLDEYEQIYGVPTNSAERYAYHTIKNLLTTPAKVVFNRLPYGDSIVDTSTATTYNDKYSVLMYPVFTSSSGGSEYGISGEETYYVGKPTQDILTETEYNQWKQGSLTWSTSSEAYSTSGGISGVAQAGKAGMILVNKIQTSVNQDFEGYYVGLSDNTKANTTATAEDFEYASLNSVQTSKGHISGTTGIDNWETLDPARLDFELTGNISDAPNSLSEAIETAPTWDFGDETYDDGLIIGLYKFRRSGYSDKQNALKFIGYESHIGSFGADRKYTQPNGFQETTFFVEKLVDEGSNFLDIMVNPILAGGQWLDDAGVPNKNLKILSTVETSTTALAGLAGLEADSAFTLGLYQEKVAETKIIGDVSKKLDLGLRLAEDWETIPMDIVLDGGLSTIHTTTKVLSADEFVDTTFVEVSGIADVTDGMTSDIAEAWATIYTQFDTFCRDTRKDCMFIADPYRNIFVQGKDFKTLDDKEKNFSQHVYTPLKNLTAICNSSYSATYAQWMKVYDTQSSDYAWIPYSGFQGAIMARLDSVLYPWSAPAGLENGLVVGGLGMALATTQKQRDLLYRNNLNAVVFFPSDGMVCWGQKTLQKKPSAFDRINVRRLFLTLEKSTRSLMKYFVFQPNTTFTRTRVVNVLTPVFDVAKNNEGVYDYLIVCDERNNTPAVIDNNELQVDIYLKPVRTAEFILVNFYATRTDQNFNELI